MEKERVYRASNEYETHNEICYNCAKDKKKQGYHIQYDLLLSEKTNLTEGDICLNCDGSFLIEVEGLEDLHNLFDVC